MEFNKEKAAEIVAKFGFSKKTINLWAFRGSIPDMYFDPEFKLPGKITGEKNTQLLKRIIDVLKNEKVNISSITRLAGIHEQKVRDVLINKCPFSIEDLNALRKAINTVRIDVTKTLESLENDIDAGAYETNFKNLYNRPELKMFVILNRNKWLLRKAKEFVSGKRPFPTKDIDTIKQSLAVYLIETAL